MDNNNKEFKRQKSAEDLFCEKFAQSEAGYSYEMQRKSYERSNSARAGQYRKNRIQRTVLLFILGVVLISLWIVAAASIFKVVLGTESYETDAPSESTDVSDTENTEPPETEGAAPGVSYITVSMAEGSHKAGELILINSDHKFDPSADSTLKTSLVSVWEYGRENLIVSRRSDLLRSDTVIAMNEMFAAFKAEVGLSGYTFRNDYGYCTASQQNEWYEAAVDKRGSNADSYEFKGGESEHETGRAFDLKVESNGAGIHIRNADEKYLWIYENCYKYGIVYRYPTDKIDITDVSMAATSVHADHFRYVGKAAAAAMNANGWCLEQLLSEIQKYSYDGEHLAVDGADGVKYEMYYFSATESGATEVKVPEGAEYSISGDNISGFVVTLTIK